jgi:pyruvate-formate lyase-activating enzyme
MPSFWNYISKWKLKDNQMVCTKPFTWLEVTGEQVYLCCPSWLSRPIGNIITQSVQQIWNGREAQKIRKSIFDGSFRYCNRQNCPFLQSTSGPVRKIKDIKEKAFQKVIQEMLLILPYGPREINCSFDKSCNLSCPTCRTQKIIEEESHILTIQDKLKKEALPDAHLLYITGSGDPFGSPYFRRWLQALKREDVPNLLNLHLHTNGQLLTPKAWNKISKGVQELIKSVDISIDAASAKTYSINRRGGSYERLLENLKFISMLRRNGPIKWLGISMVVQENNFMEMPAFVQLGKRFYVDTVYFSRLLDWGTFSQDEYEGRAIHLPSNPKHSKFLEVVRGEIFSDPIVNLGNLIEITGCNGL